MKKLIALAAASLIASGAFAAIELDASNYVMPLNVQTVDFDSGSKDVYAVVPFGFEVKSTFYFGDLQPVNVGLNIGLSTDYFKYKHYSDDLYEVKGGFDATFVCGPALCLNFKRTSFFVSPGFEATVMGIKLYDDDDNSDIHNFDVAFDLGAHIDVGYRIWLLQTEKFDLGLNFGADYSIGLGRYGTYTVDENQDKKITDDLFDMNPAHRVKAYAGISFHFDK